MKHLNVKLAFSNKLEKTNPDKNAVLIIGPKKFLSAMSYEDIEMKLSPTVSKEHYEKAIKLITANSSDTIPLHLKSAYLLRLPAICSRHNTPSQAHSISKFVKSHFTGNSDYIVILCEPQNAFASACAVARVFPLYSRKHSSEPTETVTVEFVLCTQDSLPTTSLSDSDLECMAVAAEGIRLATRIIDAPCSEMHTDAFLEEVKKVGDVLGIKPIIIRGEELQAKGFGGIYNVGKAADHPPALAVLSHMPKGAKETIAWVGKGIVFDTGGLTIKSRSGMCNMKRDCGGAAAMLGAFLLAVKMGFKENLHAVLCLAENAVGPSSMRPDDILTLYSGKTVEVNNTDCEGRLVLGDGVAYAKSDLKASTIVDMATLTGAQGSCTGRIHGAVLCNSEKWEKAAVAAGKASGDLVFPVVYSPELHFSEFNSHLADMKNMVADGSNAAVSCAGLFIGSHIGFDFEGNWMHFDIAKPSFSSERGTGYGVALLATLFGHFSNNTLLQSLSPNNPAEGDVKMNHL